LIVTIDGKEVSCERGEYLLDIATRAGIRIASLCHHEGLQGQGCCRLCTVEVETGRGDTGRGEGAQSGSFSDKKPRREIVAACIYPVEAECVVYTDSERVRRNRGILLALLRASAPASEEIAELCREFGAPDGARYEVQSGDGKCILCGLCAKACQTLGTGAISSVGRGTAKKISTPYDEPATVCVGCGSCAAVCPTGAIEVAEDGDERTIWNKTLTLTRCSRCGAVTGTAFEHYRASVHAGTEPPDLCPDCRRKAMTDTMAKTFGV